MINLAPRAVSLALFSNAESLFSLFTLDPKPTLNYLYSSKFSTGESKQFKGEIFLRFLLTLLYPPFSAPHK